MESVSAFLPSRKLDKYRRYRDIFFAKSWCTLFIYKGILSLITATLVLMSRIAWVKSRLVQAARIWGHNAIQWLSWQQPEKAKGQCESESCWPDHACQDLLFLSRHYHKRSAIEWRLTLLMFISTSLLWRPHASLLQWELSSKNTCGWLIDEPIQRHRHDTLLSASCIEKPYGELKLDIHHHFSRSQNLPGYAFMWEAVTIEQSISEAVSASTSTSSARLSSI